MKKVILGLAALLVTMSAIAQEAVSTGVVNQSSNKKLHMGIVIAPDLGFFSPNNKRTSKSGTKLGINYGLEADIALGSNSNYAFSTGLFIINTGGKMDYLNVISYPNDSSYQNSQTSSTYRIRYLNIPLTFKLKTNEVGYLRYFAQVGLDLDFNLRAQRDRQEKFYDQSGKLTTLQFDKEDITDQVTLLRASLNVGAGVEYNLQGNTSLMLKLSWNNGLNNIFNKNATLYKITDQSPTTFTSSTLPPKTDRIKSALNYFSLGIGVFF